VIGEPPSDVGALHVRVTLFPGVADISVGAPGAVGGDVGMAERAFEGRLVKGPVLVAVTVKE
jgi:hypothetical protein